MNYIGLDVHCSRIDLSLIREGKEVFRTTIETDEEKLREVIESIKGRKRVVMEEGMLADWCRRIVEPLAEEVVVCDPRRNRLVSEAEDKDDPVDAFRLAILHWMGQTRPVYHADVARQQLKESVIAYWQASSDLTRVKNRLMSQFLRRGLKPGEELYRERGCQRWREKLKSIWESELAESYFRQLHFCRQQKAERLKWLRKKAASYREPIGWLDSIPGWGWIVSVTFFALIGEPRRFPNKRKLWKYCGQAVRQPRSAGKPRARARRSREYNRMLKAVLGIAAKAVVRSQENELRDYAESLKQAGQDSSAIRRSLSRKMAATAVALLRKREPYRDRYPRKAQDPGRADSRVSSSPPPVNSPAASAPLRFAPSGDRRRRKAQKALKPGPVTTGQSQKKGGCQPELIAKP